MRAIKSLLVLCVTLTVIAGCATHPAVPREERSPADPWEPLNRQMHGFNRGFDAVTFKPVSKAYRALLGQSIRNGVTNFSLNLRGPLNIVNHLLQGKGGDALTETGRFLANSTFGIFGLVDVGTDMGLERKPEDFGQTFAKWGIPDGPFVVIPVLGGFTLRDAIAIPFNLLLDPLWHYQNAPVRDRLYVLRLIDIRYRLLAAEALLEDSADPYITQRESILQNRRYLIWDGSPPVDEDFYDDLEDFDDLDD